MVLGGIAASLYGVARADGLADLGRRVEVEERSIQRGEGLRRGVEGDWE